MGGTKAGGQKTVITNRERYGDHYYHFIGRIGGQKKGRKGFATNRELASVAGKLGGSISRKGHTRPKINPELYAKLLARLEAVKAQADKQRLGSI